MLELIGHLSHTHAAGLCPYFVSTATAAGPDARAALLAIEGVCDLIDMEIPVKGLLEDARAIEERVREAFERAQANALPAPEDQDDDDEVRMVY